MVEVKSGVVSGETILYPKSAPVGDMGFSSGGPNRGVAERTVGGGDD